jgi:hypothetical protein
MNIAITLDYEIYFGRRHGNAERTLLPPTEALAEIARRHGVPLVFFVDVAWLLRLREQGQRHPALLVEHDRVSRQLEALAAAGHELQLHVHPHWYDAHWDGEGWSMDMRRYRLHAFDDVSIMEIIGECAAHLRSLAGARRVSAFRAGGWYLQPFDRLRAALLAADIRIDSTVYAGGVQDRGGHRYDYRDAPRLSRWRFDHDPLVPDAAGPFLELPIASQEISPLWFWRLALVRTLRRGAHRPLGDGTPMAPGRADLLRKLFAPSTSVVSVDGVKSGLLDSACASARARGLQDFVVIGHPKAFTPHSLAMLERFIERHRASDRFVGLDGYRAELDAAPASTLRRA